MNYFKNLSLRQWIIIVVIILFFVVSYFVFMRRPVDNQKIDVEKLLNQGPAPMTSEENIGKDKLKSFLNPDVSSDGTSSTAKQLTNDQRSALLKLMSAPKLK